MYRRKAVYAAGEVKNLDYDVIIVANSFAKEIKEEMERQGIEREKAVFLALTKIRMKQETMDSAINEWRGVKPQYDFLGLESSNIWISFVGGNGAYSNSKELLEQRATELDMAEYWKEKDIYEPSIKISEIARRQKAFLEKYFFRS